MACSKRSGARGRIVLLVRVVLIGLASSVLAPKAAAQFEQSWLTSYAPRPVKSFFLLGQDLGPDGRVWVAADVTATGSRYPSSISGPRSLLLMRFGPEGDVEWTSAEAQPPRWTLSSVSAGLEVDAAGCAYVTSRIGPQSRLTKYSPQGDVLWSLPLDMYFGWSGIVLMELDSEERLVVAGFHSIDSSPAPEPTLIQVAPDGHVRWRVEVPDIGYDSLSWNALAIDASNRVHLSANTYVTPPSDKSITHSLAFDEDGALLWSSEIEPGHGIAVFPTRMEVRPDGSRTTAVNFGSKSSGTWQPLAVELIHMDESGRTVWTHHEDVPPGSEKYVTGIATSPEGVLVVSSMRLQFDVAAQDFVVRAQVEGFSAAGQKLWIHGSAVTCGNNQFQGPASFDPEGRIVLISTPLGPDCFPTDFAIELLSTDGEWLDTTRVDVPDGSSVHQVAGFMDAAGDLRVVGTSNSYSGFVQGGMLFAGGYRSD